MNAVGMWLGVTGTLHTPSTPGVGLKGKNMFLLNKVMLHIIYTHPQPLGWDQNVKICFY